MTADFADATRAYTRWMAAQLALDRGGLAEKRARMAEKGPFGLLRGTFYRWPWQFAAAEPAVREAPRLLSVGDLHMENFGTWRDAEGRLAWGVNDVDEAAKLPFTSDLVRLATSLLLALAAAPDRALPPAEGVAAILEGYAGGLRAGGPVVLEAEAHAPLRKAAQRLFRPHREWDAIRAGGEAAEPDDSLRHLLLTALPQGAAAPAFRRTRRGIGSLGRPRWQVVAEWQGGPVAREAKAILPSAATMGDPPPADPARPMRRLLAEARRAADPCFLIAGGGRWSVRRLSPEVRKIELRHFAPDPEDVDAAAMREGQRALLHAMGLETANIHAGTARDPAAIRDWLRARRGGRWLLDAAEAAAGRVAKDHRAFLRDPGVVEA